MSFSAYNNDEQYGHEEDMDVDSELNSEVNRLVENGEEEDIQKSGNQEEDDQDEVIQNIIPVQMPAEATPSAEATELVYSTPQEAEMRMLANKFADTYRQLVENIRIRNKVDAARADEEVQRRLMALVQQPGDEYGVQSMPPREVDWSRLSALAEHNPRGMMQVWRAINQLALDELHSGFRAAEVIAEVGETPWDQARFLALRAAMILEWKPRGGTELTLIDTLVQAQVMYERWLQGLIKATAAQMEHNRTIYSPSGVKEPPRVADAQALEQAAAMVDRFNRLQLRTLRQLRDLRRYAPAVVIQNADQVNIGEQQINLSGGNSSN